MSHPGGLLSLAKLLHEACFDKQPHFVTLVLYHVMLYPMTGLSAPPSGSLDFLPSSLYTVFEGHGGDIIVL